MTSQPTLFRIPLLGISGKVEREAQKTGELPQGLKRISEVRIPVSQSLPEQCYAMKMPNIFGESVDPSGMSLGIFGPGMDVAALNDVYALGLTGREPLVRKVIKNDAESNSSNPGEPSPAVPSSRAKNSRKSFMTPTPLHIPGSRVSPIPDSAHEMIYLKDLSENEALKVVPLQDVVWVHPLISVVESPPG
jgi:hypothetical protein